MGANDIVRVPFCQNLERFEKCCFFSFSTLGFFHLRTNVSKTLVLASSSASRKLLLSKLGVDFISTPPEIDESPNSNESPFNLVSRLAYEKARAIKNHHPNHLIIGSDQIALVRGRILDKPGSHGRAVEQLQQQSGETVQFLTSLCAYNSPTSNTQVDVVPCNVSFRTLTTPQHREICAVGKPLRLRGQL